MQSDGSNAPKIPYAPYGPRNVAKRRSAGDQNGRSGNGDTDNRHLPETDKVFLTIEELAEVLTLSVGCIRAWRARGEGPPAVRFGNRLRWDRREIEAWVDARRESSLADRG